MFKRQSFWPVISIYTILGLYLLGVTYMTPFLGIQLKESGDFWEIDDLANMKWTSQKNVSEGDIILEIDNVPILEVTRLQYDPYIRGANQLLIKKSNGQILEVNVTHVDVLQQLYMQIVLPSIYFLLTLCITIYLYYKKNMTPYLNIIIAFIFSVSLAYISSGASARGDNIGILVNSGFLIFSVIVLLIFLKSYFNYLGIKWVFIEDIKYLLILPFVAVVLRLIKFAQPNISPIDTLLILTMFFLLLIMILWILLRSYSLYKVPQIKILFLGLILPFLPFLFLFVLPELLLNRPILGADICSVFLLLIPFNIMLLQLTERLFDIVYHITRFRYYFTISIVSTIWLTIGLVFIFDLSYPKMFAMSLFIFISIIFLLYVKEILDYRGRKVLFSYKGNNLHKLYQIIGKLGESYRVDHILSMLESEVANYLEISSVNIITYEMEKKDFKSSKEVLNVSIDIDLILKLTPGEIIKKGDRYIVLIHQDLKYKRLLMIEPKYKTRLNVGELIWLELLLSYTNTFIESTKLIEELIEELQGLQQIGVKEPTWLKKLLFLRVDEEKFKFAQELHDIFLQEYLHIARELNWLIAENNQESNRLKLPLLHEQMIHSIDKLRAYCETLKPPLLKSMGLNAALERLSDKTAERADFVLNATFDRLYLENEQLTLIIYRIVQELLNNALKHSQASKVNLNLVEIDSGFELIYQDNGVGCDLGKIWGFDSLGLQGIRERVDAFNGSFVVDTEEGRGMYIKIEIIDGSDVIDFSINNR